MTRKSVAAERIQRADKRLILIEVHARHTDHIPEPHYHKADVIQQSLLKQRVYKRSAAEREQARQDILRARVLTSEQVHDNMLAEPQAEYREYQKAYNSRRYEYRHIPVMYIVVMITQAQSAV